MDWVGLVEAPDQITAESWCELLEREGIPAFAKTTSSGGYANIILGPSIPVGCWVMVHEEDLDRAADILDSAIGPGRRRKRAKGQADEATDGSR